MAPPKGPSRATIRWRPTPDQLVVLEELFRGGVRTPTAHQIQKITAQLKEHGKVECKNVFYWFQNHKAREKQKLRKKLHQQHIINNNNNNFLYYYLHPQQYAAGFWPLFPTQVIKGQLVPPAEVNKSMEKTDDNNNGSSWVVTWLSPDSDADHRRENRPPPKTLELFPTTASSTTTTEAAASSLCSTSL